MLPASATIAREAANYSRLIALILAFEVVAITLGVAWVVTRGVTRPIRTLSDDLHRLDAVERAARRAPAGPPRTRLVASPATSMNSSTT